MLDGSRFCGCFCSGFLGSAVLAELACVTVLTTFRAGPGGIYCTLGRFRGLCCGFPGSTFLAEIACVAGFSALLTGPGGGGNGLSGLLNLLLSGDIGLFLFRLLLLIFLFADISVEKVVHALLYFIADVFFHGILRPVLEPVKETLRICGKTRR